MPTTKPRSEPSRRPRDGGARILDWRPSGAEYDPPLDRALAGLRPRLADAAREQAEAPALLASLLGHTPERRQVLVGNSRRFGNLALSGLLLDRGARERTDEPWAGLALRVIENLEPASYGAEVLADARARCWLRIADSRRTAGDPAAAAEALRTAADLLRRGTGDRLAKARLLAGRARLRQSERRCDEAADLFRRAISLLLSIGEADRAAAAKVELALLEQRCAEPHRKVKAWRSAAAASSRS